jgi:hypothetical protein
MADKPVAFWQLDETSGTTARDQAGQVNGSYSGDPTLGAPSLVPGDPGRSVKFDGTDDRVLANRLPAAGGSWAEMTLEAWVEVTRPVPPAEEHLINFSTSKGGHAPGLFHDNPTDKIKWDKGSSQTPALSNAPVTSGTLYVVATVDRNNVAKLYINGVLQATQGTIAARPEPDDLFQIGADYDTGPEAVSFWQGRIDDVAVYNVALDQARITAHYQAGTTSAG